MSFKGQPWRPFARSGAGDFRGAVASVSGHPGGPARGQIGTVFARRQAGANTTSLVFVTKTAADAIAPNCIVKLYLSSTGAMVATTTSDAAGNARFDNVGAGPFFARAYRAGAPELAGTTVNTLVPT